MSFEDAVLRKIHQDRMREKRESPRETPRGALIEKAHEQAKKLFATEGYAIQAPDFFDLYGKENVVADMLKVKQKQIAFEREQTPEHREIKKMADVFEAVVLQQAELSNWLGGNVSVLKTSLYDDYFNGTDMIAEWTDAERESNVLALAVDVTFGKASVERKLLRLRRDVENGKLGTIKYFKNSDDSFRGEKKGVPHAVIGVDKRTVETLAQLWMQGDKKALAAHPIQRALVDEMLEQLKTVQRHALACGQTKVADAYRRSLAIVERIGQEKSSVPLGELVHDRVYGEIMSQTRSVFRP